MGTWMGSAYHYLVSGKLMQEPGINDGQYAQGGMADRMIISVADLTRAIRLVIENEDLFQDVWVRGEISNFSRHSSGHIYFSLKDESALIRCVIWNNQSNTCKFELGDGLRVIAHGRVTVYERGGQYQLVVKEVLHDGVGTLYAAFEQLKEKLRAEGLFEVSAKKPIPVFPKRIAIVTSPTSAALRDMVTIARRRMPCVDLLVVPTLMQGDDAESSVVQSLQLADAMPNVDVIVVGRGGGSIEDLWTFNTEAVVRAIAACDTPVVSAIGHETDYTLSDMVADLRAPTPSAAMELILQNREDMLRCVQMLRAKLVELTSDYIEQKQDNLDALCGARCMRFPHEMLADKFQSLDILRESLERHFEGVLTCSEARLGEVLAKLHSLSPLAVLARGYAIVRRPVDGSVVRCVSDVSVSEIIETLLCNGSILSEVKAIREG